MESSDARVRVVVADDHPFFRDGVARGLVHSGRIEVVAEAGDGREALEAIRRDDPDVALVDYDMPDIDGLGVVRAAVRDGLRTRVLLLSAHTDSAVVFQALQEGAAGYLAKDAKRAEIVEAVIDVARGPRSSRRAGGRARREIRIAGQVPRTRVVRTRTPGAAGVRAGTVGAGVAGELFIGVSTVKTHTQRLYEKLGVSDRAAAVAEGMRRGLVE